METFPTWSPDGRKIYFCRAITPGFSSLTDSMKIDYLVDSFEEKGYNVIMVNTDSIKIEGKYNRSDNLVTIGDGLGEFKVEYEGMAEYISEGHYKEQREKWKGKPAYMIDGYSRCKFIENIEEELEIYEKYAII